MTAATLHLLDAATARRLEGTDIFDNPLRPAELARFIADPSHCLVFAEVANQPVGFASGVIQYHPDKPPELFIKEVGVTAAFRRRGIGRQVVQRLLDEAWAAGCSGAWVITEDDNDAARALYRSVPKLISETSGNVIFDWAAPGPS
ncbi:MAG: GNAT family N-acetyltransferase [Pseudomonadota bacterium]